MKKNPVLAKAKSKGKKGEHPLFDAAMDDDADMIRKLVGNGADVNMRDAKTDESPLHFAAMLNNKNAAKALIEMKANVNANTENHHLPLFMSRGTPLHIAASLGHDEMISILLEAKANVNARDELKDTPLHATMTSTPWGHAKNTLNLLLAAGADPTLRGQHDRTPAELANEEGEPELRDLLNAAAVNFKKATASAILNSTTIQQALNQAAPNNSNIKKKKKKKKKKKTAIQTEANAQQSKALDKGADHKAIAATANVCQLSPASISNLPKFSISVTEPNLHAKATSEIQSVDVPTPNVNIGASIVNKNSYM